MLKVKVGNEVIFLLFFQVLKVVLHGDKTLMKHCSFQCIFDQNI